MGVPSQRTSCVVVVVAPRPCFIGVGRGPVHGGVPSPSPGLRLEETFLTGAARVPASARITSEETTMTTTNNTRIVKVGHARLGEVEYNGVRVVAFRFEKRRIQRDRQGEVVSERPFTQKLYLVRLPGRDRCLWVHAHERRPLLEALEEIGSPPGDGGSKEPGERELPRPEPGVRGSGGGSSGGLDGGGRA